MTSGLTKFMPSGLSMVRHNGSTSRPSHMSLLAGSSPPCRVAGHVDSETASVAFV